MQGVTLRDMVVRCVAQMVQAKADNIKFLFSFFSFDFFLSLLFLFVMLELFSSNRISSINSWVSVLIS